RGCVDHNSITMWNNLLVFVGKDGIYSFDGRKVELISNNITKFFKQYDLQQDSISPIKRINFSTYRDFNDAKQYINNFRITGTSLDTLSSAKNFILDTADSFYNNCGYSEKILFSDGIQLEPISSTFNWSVDVKAKQTIGDKSYIFDGDYNTFYHLKSRSEGRSNQFAEIAEATIKINFTSQVFLTSINLKLSILSSIEATVGITQYDLEVYVDGQNVKKYGERYEFGNYKLMRDFNEQIITNMSCNNITIKVKSYAHSYRISNLNISSNSEIKFYEIIPNYEIERSANGVYYTRWIDTEKEENFGFSNVEYITETPSGTSVVVQYTQSDTSSIPVNDSSLTWTNISSGQIPNITKRFYAYKFILQRTIPTKTPIVKLLRQNFLQDSVYIGKKTLIQPVYFKNFYCSYNTFDGILKFYVSKDGSDWVEVENDRKIPFTDRIQEIWIKVQAKRTGDTGCPVVYSIILTYTFESGIIVYQPIQSYENNNRCFIKIYDTLFILCKNGSWSKIDNSGITCIVNSITFLVFKNRFLGKFFDDDFYDKECYITTKTFTLGSPLESFMIRKIWLFFDNNVKTSSNNVLEIYNGKSLSPVSSFNVYFDKNKNLTDPVEINCGIKCYQFFAKVKNTNPTDDFSLVGIQFYIRPLRILSKEE
ncbi:MAG: hypothetical protein N2Z73_02935, partial [Endomicrobia bacterium]|nr:hypothetical protein [Endomicrobiia bacterium]